MTTESQKRRARAGTAEGKQEALAAAAQGDIKPPAHVTLRDGDLPYWTAVVRARAREVWTDADLIHAGNLARCMADIERLQTEIGAEGDVIENARGTPVANPKHALLEVLSRRAIAITRLIGVNPRGQNSQAARDGAVAKHAEDEAKAALAETDDDDLIPRATTLQ